MSLPLRGASALALGLILAPAAAAQPATPLAAVPADAVMVVQPHGLARTKESLKRDPAGFDTATIDGQAVCLCPRGGFACVAASPALATKLAKPAEGDAGLAKKLGPAAASFLEPDLALFVDVAAVNQQYGN